MTDEEVNKMWSEDCKIDELDLSGESQRIPKLHSKYYNLYFKQVLRVKKFKSEYKELEKAKTEYYNGSMDELELKRRGWPQNPLRILKQDMDKYIQSISYIL